MDGAHHLLSPYSPTTPSRLCPGIGLRHQVESVNSKRGSNVVCNLHLGAPLSAALANGDDTLSITADCYSIAAAPVGRLPDGKRTGHTDAATAGVVLAYRMGPDQDVFTTNQISRHLLERSSCDWRIAWNTADFALYVAPGRCAFFTVPRRARTNPEVVAEVKAGLQMLRRQAGCCRGAAPRPHCRGRAQPSGTRARRQRLSWLSAQRERTTGQPRNESHWPGAAQALPVLWRGQGRAQRMRGSDLTAKALGVRSLRRRAKASVAHVL